VTRLVDAYREIGHYLAVLDLELTDLVRVIRTPPGGGDENVFEVQVEGIAHSLDPDGMWRTRLFLSPSFEPEEE
jgi:hypothetical protein